MRNLPKTRLSVIFSCISILIFCKGLYTIRDWKTVSNYYSVEGDALPSAEDPSFCPKTKSIFFHDTSFHGQLTPWQACSVEAAARVHSQLQVYVLFSSPVTEYALKSTCLSKLQQFHNIKLLRVHIAEYARGTIVHPILLNGLKKSKYPMQHLLAILKILTLNKWGGICVDTDMIVVRSLESLRRNWIVKQGDRFVAPGLFSFDKDEIGRNITSLILKDIFENYNPDDWSGSGRRAIQNVIQRICPIKVHWDDCPDITIYPHELFYPVDHLLWKQFYQVSSFLETTFSYHLWNFMTSSRSIVNRTRYKMLARRACPSIYGLYSEELAV